MQAEQRRIAERILIAPELEAVLADTPGRIGEIATLGCRFEHAPRLPIGTSMPLRLTWEGQPIALRTKIVWSELKLTGGDKFYHSGLQFGDEAPAELAKIRVALGKHLTRVLANLFPELPLVAKPRPVVGAVPFMATPFLSVGVEQAAPKPASATFLEFRLRNGKWDTLETPALSQPRDGLSFPASFDPEAIEIWRSCFERSEEPVRRMLRAALEIRVG